MTSAFKMNTTPGSRESLEMLNAIAAVKNLGNEEVFLSKFALLVDYKWSKSWASVYLEGALYLSFYTFVILD